MKIRTRFAPSPTGHLHIGGVRTAMYAYALAHGNKGDFVLRIEDTDQNRYVEGSVDMIFDSLKEYGLEPDESIKHGGDFGPYMQSERLELYQKYAHQLVESGHAYYCFATKTEIESQKEAADASGERFIFCSPYSSLNNEEAKKRIENGESYVVRQKIPANREIVYEDAVQGTLKFNTNDVNEGILLKSDGYPTYHLAVVVDDHLMEISHVFRGAEWISSLPKHLLLYEAFGWEVPIFAHLTLILDPDGGKLSKRKGAISADGFLDEGYLPEAINNFLMLLGWSSPENREHGEKENEFYSMHEFAHLFKVEDLNKSNAVFDRQKLVWFNQKYIQMMGEKELLAKLKAFVARSVADNPELEASNKKLATYLENEELVKQLLPITKERAKLLGDFTEQFMPFFEYDEKNIDVSSIKQLKKLDLTTLKQLIEKYRTWLLETLASKSLEELTHEEWEMKIRELADSLELKHGQAFMTTRVATLGTPFSPPLFESMKILGKEETIARLDKFLLV